MKKKKHAKKSVGGRPSNEVLQLRAALKKSQEREELLTGTLRGLSDNYERAVKAGQEGQSISLREAGAILLDVDAVLKKS